MHKLCGIPRVVEKFYHKLTVMTTAIIHNYSNAILYKFSLTWQII